MSSSHQFQGRTAAIPQIAALQAFERAGTHLSFRRAAQDLALTPSAVSHQIRNLEAHFGVRLFARAGRSVRLTEAGVRYHADVRRALAALEAAGRELVDAGAGAWGELHVSALPFFTRTVLIPAMADFQARHPRLALRIEATHQYADFDSSAVDVSIRFGRERALGLRMERLVAVRSRPYCVPALLERLGSPADLAGLPLIHVLPQPSSWARWFEAAGLSMPVPDGGLWFDSVPSALEAAEQGLGVALGMEPLMAGWSGTGTQLIAPFDITADRGAAFYLVCRPEQADRPKVVAFRAWVREALDAIADTAG